MLTGKRVLVTGGTGSLGNVLVRRLLGDELGRPEQVVVFSRDEAKQHAMRLAFRHRRVATDEVIYDEIGQRLRFQIGDVADYPSVSAALREADVVFQAAALKQVPSCEYFPFQAVKTNILGPENVVRAIREHGFPVEIVVGISTDKACKPVNVMGMTKAIQERIFIQANMDCARTRFVLARYGNVLASRGSVIPLFHDQIRRGGPVTLTTPDMTRFLMSLDQAVDTIFAAARDAGRGETYVPRLPSVRLVDLAAALIGDRPIETTFIGIRPGEKTHESLISREEASRTVERGPFYAILPMLPELRAPDEDLEFLDREFSSADAVVSRGEVAELLRANEMRVEDDPVFAEHFPA